MRCLWFDVETTGLDPAKHGIIEIGCLVVISGTVRARLNLLMNPIGKEIDSEALQVNGHTEQEIQLFPLPEVGVTQLTNQLARYVAKEKLIPAGYNIDRFDIPFLKALFADHHVDYSQFFSEQTLDLYRDLAVYEQAGFLNVPNHKLTTVAKSLGVNTDGAHGASEDARIAREAAIILQKAYIAKKGVEDWRQKILEAGEENG